MVLKPADTTGFSSTTFWPSEGYVMCREKDVVVEQLQSVGMDHSCWWSLLVYSVVCVGGVVVLVIDWTVSDSLWDMGVCICVMCTGYVYISVSVSM